MSRLLAILSSLVFATLLLLVLGGAFAILFAFDAVRPLVCEGPFSESRLDCIREWQPLASAAIGFLIGAAALLALLQLVAENRAQRRILEAQVEENRIQREAMQEQFKVATWDIKRRIDNALSRVTNGLTVRLANLKQTYEVLGESYTRYGLASYSESVARSARRFADELKRVENELHDTNLFPLAEIADKKSNGEHSGLVVYLRLLRESVDEFIAAYHVPSNRESEGEDLFKKVQASFEALEQSADSLIRQLKLNRSDFEIER